MDRRLDDVPEAIRKFAPKMRPREANGQQPEIRPQRQPPRPDTLQPPQQAAQHAQQAPQYVQQHEPPHEQRQEPRQEQRQDPRHETRHDDPTDAAGMALMALLQQAARSTEESRDNAVGLAERLAHELRAVEDRMAQLTAALEHYRGRAEHAEHWLKQIQVEIEQKLITPQAPGRNPTN
jgi:DNA repair ATPase RecN